MLVSDRFYKGIPKVWLIMGSLFLILALATGPEFRYFYGYLALGAVCIARSYHIYQHRRNISRRNKTSVLMRTQKIERNVPLKKR